MYFTYNSSLANASLLPKIRAQVSNFPVLEKACFGYITKIRLSWLKIISHTKNDFQTEIVNHYFLIINTIETIIILIILAIPIIIVPNKIGLSVKLNKNSSN